MTTARPTVSFDTELTAFGNNTGIVVPPEKVEELGAGKRPAVDVDLNGHIYRSTVGVMAGQSLISVSAAIRKTDETRQRRVDKAIGLFLDGKKR